jgi:hypothetical protein
MTPNTAPTGWTPKPIHVFCTVTPTPGNGLKKPMTSRIATAHTLDEARAAIATDLKAMCMPSIIGNERAEVIRASRHYAAFEATWTPLNLEASA